MGSQERLGNWIMWNNKFLKKKNGFFEEPSNEYSTNNSKYRRLVFDYLKHSNILADPLLADPHKIKPGEILVFSELIAKNAKTIEKQITLTSQLFSQLMKEPSLNNIKHSGFEKMLAFRFLLPKKHREEFTGDFLEIRNTMAKEGHSTWFIYLILFLHMINIIWASAKFKLDKIFCSKSDKIIEQ